MNEKFKKEVIKRFSDMPENLIFNIEWGSFSRDEIIKHIILEDETGELIIEMETNFDENFNF